MRNFALALVALLALLIADRVAAGFAQCGAAGSCPIAAPATETEQ